jgi:hypothetical protein
MPQLTGDQAQRFGPEFPGMAGEDECNGCLLREDADIPLQPPKVGRAQPMQRGHGASLKEVGHGR